MEKKLLIISKTKWLQYIFLFISFQYIGGRLIAYYGGGIHIVFLGLSLLIIISNSSRFRKAAMGNWLITLVVSMLVTFGFSFGGLSIATIVAVICRFLVAWIAVAICPEKFEERLINLCIFLSFFSVIIYFSWNILQIPALNSLTPHMARVIDSEGKTISYGLFILVFDMFNRSRNSGIFGEPGEMQIMVNLALYFLFFRTKNMESNRKIKDIVILIFTMLTVLSTTGLINMAVIFILYLAQAKRSRNKQISNIIMIVVIAFGIYAAFFASPDSFIYENLLDKVTVDGQIDVSQSSGAARTLSFELLSDVFISKPQAMIFGVGFSGLSQFMTEKYALACAGLISGLIMFGIFTYIVIYGKFIQTSIRRRTSWMEVLCLTFFVVMNGLSQPDILSIVPVLLTVYLIYCSDSIKNQECVQNVGY